MTELKEIKYLPFAFFKFLYQPAFGTFAFAQPHKPIHAKSKEPNFSFQ